MFENISYSKCKTVRPSKGTSLIEFPNSYTAIDLETTGFSPEYDFIIELAAIKVKDNKIVESFSSLAYEEDVHINEFITNLTGITQDMISSAPALTEILPAFFDFISDDIVIGHNVNFDVNFLYDKSIRYLNKPFSNSFVDTMRISRRLHPELPHHRLIDLSERYSIDSSGAHRSLADCQITLSCYTALRDEIISIHLNEENFMKSCCKRSHSSPSRSVRSADIISSVVDFDESHPLYKKVCVFTGRLDKMVRKDAMQIVSNLGGINADNVTSKTNFLILGNNDYCTTIKDGKSSKQKKAESLKLSGKDIEIIPENVFYDMIFE